jgi:hypothetical protein
MNPVIRFFTIIPLVMALSCGGAGDHGISEEQAVAVAEEWLQLTDQGLYEESWNEAASLLKSAVTVERWQQQLKAARSLFGEFRSRKLKGARYMTSMAGAPDGEYVVIQFDTSFSKKETAVETITPMKDEDGEWRVSGYYIK